MCPLSLGDGLLGSDLRAEGPDCPAPGLLRGCTSRALGLARLAGSGQLLVRDVRRRVGRGGLDGGLRATATGATCLPSLGEVRVADLGGRSGPGGAAPTGLGDGLVELLPDLGVELDADAGILGQAPQLRGDLADVRLELLSRPLGEADGEALRRLVEGLLEAAFTPGHLGSEGVDQGTSELLAVPVELPAVPQVDLADFPRNAGKGLREDLQLLEELADSSRIGADHQVEHVLLSGHGTPPVVSLPYRMDGSMLHGAMS